MGGGTKLRARFQYEPKCPESQLASVRRNDTRIPQQNKVNSRLSVMFQLTFYLLYTPPDSGISWLAPTIRSSAARQKWGLSNHSVFCKDATVPAALRNLQTCPDCKRSKINGSKNLTNAKSIGNDGDLTYRSGSGAPFVKITVSMARRGSSSPLSMRMHEPTAGAKMASEAFAIVIR